jgi:predicted ribosome quality control (RQC) complex YloA/Tae2 family protein
MVLAFFKHESQVKLTNQFYQAEIAEQERKIQHLQERHDKDIRRQESEIDNLGRSISEARERANVGQEDADEIDRIMRSLISDFEVQLEPKLDELVR